MGDIKQGAVEEANVDISAEMLRMIQAQQAYNGNARALQTGSEMLRSAIETLMRG
jgi:flagellar hook protein FlgE